MYIRCLICLPFPHQSFTILQVKFGRIENTTKSAPCQHKFRLVIVTVHPTLFKHAELMINPFLHMLMTFMCKKCMKVDKTSRMALQNLEIGNALEIKPNCKDGTTSTMFFLRLECILYRVLVSNVFYFHPCLGKIPILTSIFQRGWNHQPDTLDISFIFRYSNRRHPISCWCARTTGQQWEFPKTVTQLTFGCATFAPFRKLCALCQFTYSNSSSCTLCVHRSITLPHRSKKKAVFCCG